MTSLNDAQYGIGQLLRPYEGFSTVYQGANVTRPIYFFPQDDPVLKNGLDPQAGKSGYDPDLLAGLKVPMGASLKIWIPTTLSFDTTVAVPGGTVPYTFVLRWRIRNFADYAISRQRPPFHIARGSGTPDTTAPVGEQARVLLPVATTTVTYIQPEPTTELAVQQVYSESFQFYPLGTLGANFEPPLTAAGNDGVVEQGVIDPGDPAYRARDASFLVHETPAYGDELLVSVIRSDEVSATWDFAALLGPDRFLESELASSPALGVYVFMGKDAS